jgi:hypothetical protein
MELVVCVDLIVVVVVIVADAAVYEGWHSLLERTDGMAGGPGAID